MKEKRMVVKSMIKRIQSRYNVSIAEIGQQEKWQRSQIGFACIGNDHKHLEKTIQEVLRFAEADGRAEVMDIHQEIL